MKLEQPIIFTSLEELQEAVDHKVIKSKLFVRYTEHYSGYSFPIIVWVTGAGINHQPLNELESGVMLSYIELIQQSVMWSDVKDKYAPEWYELEKNIDKLVAVKDKDDKDWTFTTFLDYRSEDKYKFVTDESNWEEARLIDPKELATQK